MTITLSTTKDLGTVRAFYEAHHGALHFWTMEAGFAVRSMAGPRQDLVGVDTNSIPRVCGHPSTGHGTVLLLTTHFGL